MADNKYITTPIYYVNDVPHIGHSYTTIIGDVLARYYRLIGKDVFYMTGTDEHGQKIEKSAEAKGLTPKELVDDVVLRFKEMWQKLNISNDYFIRTTDEDHKKVVQEVFRKIYDKGYIYLGEYEGLYCRPCESYYTETQVEDNKCPECKRELIVLKEEAYFFKLSAFADKILEHINKNPKFVLPESRKNEVVSFINQGLEDLCISRTTINWGIDIPEVDEKAKQKHYIYVWFDALTNYITGVKYLQDDDTFGRYWPAFIHLIGKDILKFHCVIWPAMLMALDLPLPQHVFGHGFIYQGGEKMSKSRGNVVDPNEIVSEYGIDAFRYYITREIVFGLDGTYSDENMLKRYNADLANDYGNLINRTLNMMKKYFDLTIVEYDESMLNEHELKLKTAVMALEKNVHKNMDEFKLSVALEEIFVVIRMANKYIEETTPWVLSKNGETKKLMTVMLQILETIRIASIWLMPFMPESIGKAFKQINTQVDLSDIKSDFMGWGFYKEGMTLNAPEPLFPRK